MGFHWWRSGNITRTQNVSEYVLVVALCLVLAAKTEFVQTKCNSFKTRLQVKPTASRHVENDSNVDVEVLGLNGEEDGAIETERIWVAVEIAVHLSDGVEAVLTLDCHLSIALMTVGRSTEEVVQTQRTLPTQPC